MRSFRLVTHVLTLFVFALVVVGSSALAQTGGNGATPFVPSTCLAVARNMGTVVPVRFASFTPPPQLAQSTSAYDVTISYQGHSTYLIESPGGVKIATDYAGWLTDRVTPDVVTMNQAHSSHYTNYPSPDIETVLRGWRDDGQPAKHRLQVEDTVIRNVTTDLLRFMTVADGNSIFIFEMGGLCIGHLGHLHHRLSEEHYAEIGRLDVVMVPVDGGLTMSHTNVKEVLDRLRSSVVLPMHVRSYGALPRFLSYLGDGFVVQDIPKNRLTLSLRTLPKTPTVMVLPGVGSYSPPDE